MGAIDLVVQIEAPPSVASGMQRIGRAGPSASARSAKAIIFPKFRGDLLACAAVDRRDASTGASSRRAIRAIRSTCSRSRSSRWPSMDAGTSTSCSRWSAAPRRSRSSAARVFDGVLDMLSGRYPSDEFAELRPRVTWDRVDGTVVAPRRAPSGSPSPTAARFPTAGSTACSWPARERARARVGELDEEMVFEARVGETFLLGASTWRIEEITHDRVLVSPAPGEPGKMPFWKGDAAGPAARARARHRQAGARARGACPPAAAIDRLEQRARPRSHWRRRTCCSTSTISSAPPASCPTIAPSSSSAAATSSATGASACCRRSAGGSTRRGRWPSRRRSASERGIDVETMWSDDGFVVRFPEARRAARPARCSLPDPDEVEELVVRQLGRTALFAAKFREAAARALLLPRRRPGSAPPLWQQRKRAADLLAVASRFGSFPMILETYRECLRDVFDMPALVDTLRDDRAARASAWSPSTRRRRRRSRRRCCSATSPTSSTTATRRWPSAARRRWRSIRRSCASCSARPSCASCSTPRRSTRPSSSCSSCPSAARANAWTRSTTCCCASAI